MRRAVFDSVQKLLEFMRGRKRDYTHTFLSQAGQRVLQDLADFCRADETCFDPDPRVHAAKEGRREVWLRIQQHLNLTATQLAEIYSGRQINPEED